MYIFEVPKSYFIYYNTLMIYYFEEGNLIKKS